MSYLKNLSRPRLIGLSIGLAIVLFLSVNVFTSNTFQSVRADLTEGNLYSLSNGTKTLLSELDEPLHMRLFLSESLVQSAPQLAAYAKRVRSMLDTYANRADGKITLEVIDPKPFSDAEDRAVGLGINRIRLAGVADPLFFGLAVTNSTDGKANIPVFAPDREAFLEYDLTRLVAELGQNGKPVVAVLDGIGLSGNPVARTQQQQVMSQLKEVYEVEFLNGDVDKLPDNTRVVMAVHPQNLSDRTLYTLDQWALSGGATMVFVDPHAETQTGPQPGMPAPNATSDFDKLFKAWGVEFDGTKAVADAGYAIRTGRNVAGRQVEVPNYPWLSLRGEAIEKSDVILSQLSSLVLTTAGNFVAKGENVSISPLLTASSDAGLVKASDAASPYGDPRELLNSLETSDKPLILAGRLNGTIKTAFADGKPEGSEFEGEHLKELKGKLNIILVGDADMLMDRNWIHHRQIFGQQIAQAFANNGDFVLNTVEQMAGGVALADLRGRGVSWRPFERIAALEKAADEKYRTKEQELVKRLQETEEKIRKLSADKPEQKGDFVSEETVQAVEQFRADLLSTRAQLRTVQHDLRRDVEQMKAWVTTANVGLIPAIVAAGALGFAIRRPRRSVPKRRGRKG
ncbi:MAG: GldG family protein [Rhizobiales bacterium]|nr:GldG family protein [Hyphomicrobiales bacterium]